MTKFLCALVRNEEKTSEFTWKHGLKEFIENCSETREATSFSPSGLHMSHWKISLEKDQIVALHAFFI